MRVPNTSSDANSIICNMLDEVVIGFWPVEFEKARNLPKMLEYMIKNNFKLEKESMEKITNILNKMESDLDNKSFRFQYNKGDIENMENLYLNIAQYVCMLKINQACEEINGR